MTVGTAGRSVLVVDDEPGIREMLTFILEPLGFAVTTAADGAAGVAAVTGRSFDLVIMDVNMPVIGGFEAARRIRDIRPAQAMLILSSTAGDRAAGNEVPGTGPLACLYKPLCLDELMAFIHQALGASVTR